MSLQWLDYSHGESRMAEGKHLYFNFICWAGKTMRIAVLTNPVPNYLGEVKWYAPWRRYCFYSGTDTVFEQVCLRDIAEFVEALTKKHKQARRT